MPKTAKEQLGVDLPEPEPVAPPEPEVTEPERPEWLPENFEKPEDLAASYREAQTKIKEQGDAQRRLEAQLGELTETIQNLQQAQPQQQQQQQGFNQDQLVAMYENDPLGTMAWMAQQFANQAVAQQAQMFQQPLQQQQMAQNQLLAMAADQALGAQFDDWSDYKDRVADAVMRDPTLLPEAALVSPDTTTRALANVYKAIKFEDLQAQLTQQTQQQSAEQQSDLMRRQAQTLGGGGARPGAPSENDEKVAQILAAAKSLSYSAMRGGE